MSKLSEILESAFAPEAPAAVQAPDEAFEFEPVEPTYVFEAAPKEPKRKKRSTREIILARRS